MPEGARRLTFWLHPVDGGPPTGTLTVDLGTGAATWAAT